MLAAFVALAWCLAGDADAPDAATPEPLQLRIAPASRTASGRPEYVLERGGVALSTDELEDMGLDEVDPRITPGVLRPASLAMLAFSWLACLLGPLACSLAWHALLAGAFGGLGALTSLNGAPRGLGVDVLVSAGYGTLLGCLPAGLCGLAVGGGIALVTALPAWTAWAGVALRTRTHPYVRFAARWNRDVAGGLLAPPVMRP